MAEYSANAAQTVAAGSSVIFTTSPVPCDRGFIQHRDDSGSFLLRGWVPPSSCCREKSAKYLCDFGCNIAVPTTGTAGEVSLVMCIDGVEIPSSLMLSTPGGEGEFNNISSSVIVEIWPGCCQTLTIKNTSSQAVTVQNANIVFSRPDLNITR